MTTDPSSTRVMSKDLTPGTRLKWTGPSSPNRPDIAVLQRRKNPFGTELPGWWVESGGGLADCVIDHPDSKWEVIPDTIEKSCDGCRGQKQFEYYGKMLDCSRCAGTGRVVCDVCPCCGSHLHERSLTRDEQLRAESESTGNCASADAAQRPLRPKSET